MNRRQLLKAAAALPLAQIAFADTAFAQAGYPNRNINMIVPFPAGGQADLAARPVALAWNGSSASLSSSTTVPVAPAARSATRKPRAPSPTATPC
jgi:tripartite-type tricarboxylate transporter receptor subunit TctC